jgi:hypothetical protein
MEPKRDTSSYTPDPGTETQYVLDGFVASLVELVHPPDGGSVLAQRVTSRAAALEQLYGDLARDELSRHNLRYACWVLAAYEALAEVDAADAIDLLRRAFLESGRFVREKTREWLDQSSDAFRDIVLISKSREQLQLGDGFVFERERDDEQAYLLNIRRCFWNDCFAAMGHAELTRVLCEFDRNWFSVIDPAHHGLRFERETTLGWGGTHCPFHFWRTRPKMG